MYYGMQKYFGCNVSEEVLLDVFNLVDLQVSCEFLVCNRYIVGMEVFVNGSNLFNEEVCLYNLLLKYIVLLLGCGFQVGVMVWF